jgi:hypothetical protein
LEKILSNLNKNTETSTKTKTINNYNKGSIHLNQSNKQKEEKGSIDRKKWIKKDKPEYFIKNDYDNTWTEWKRGDKSFSFEEKESNDQYIIIYEASRNLHVKLENEYALWTRNHHDFYVICSGNWANTIKSNNLPLLSFQEVNTLSIHLTKTLRLRNRAASRYLVTTNEGECSIHLSNGGDYQKWKFIKANQNNGYFCINQATKSILDYEIDTKNFICTRATYNEDKRSQIWFFLKDGTIRNFKYPDICLEVNNNNVYGNVLDSNNLNQRWDLIE